MAENKALFYADDLRVVLSGNSHREPVLSGAHFTVHEGSITGLIGETGSGKSVSLRASLGMLPSQLRLESGQSYFQGQRLQDLSSFELRRIRGSSIGFIPQQPWSALNPVQTIKKQFLDLGLSHGKSRKWVNDRAKEVLDRVGIRHVNRVLNGYVGELSGGMAQRVLIAMAILLSPKLIVADEPTTALDVTVQSEILGLIRSICDEDLTGVLIVTHDLGVVANFCDQVYVMNAGRILESGSVTDVFSSSSDEYTRELISASTRHTEPDDYALMFKNFEKGNHHG